MCSEWHPFFYEGAFACAQNGIHSLAKAPVVYPEQHPLFCRADWLILKLAAVSLCPEQARQIPRIFVRANLFIGQGTFACIQNDYDACCSGAAFFIYLAIEASLCTCGCVHRQKHRCLYSDQHLFCRLVRGQILTHAATCLVLEQAWQIRRVCMLGDWERESVFATVLREGKEVVSTHWTKKGFVLADHLISSLCVQAM